MSFEVVRNCDVIFLNVYRAKIPVFIDGEDKLLYKFCAVDKDGDVYLYKQKPDIDLTCDTWGLGVFCSGDYFDAGLVEYEGDWKESLVEIKPEDWSLI